VIALAPSALDDPHTRLRTALDSEEIGTHHIASIAVAVHPSAEDPSGDESEPGTGLRSRS